MNEKILLIDDDLEFGRLIEVVLKQAGMIVSQAYTGREGIRKAYEMQPDLVILDVMMPGLNGYEVCSHLREMAHMPVLMLTARGNPSDVLRGFDSGVDDYLNKPFNREELLARIRALLRRSKAYNRGAEFASNTQYTDKTLHIDLDSQTVQVAGKTVEFSPTEYKLLGCLVRNMGKIVSTRELLREVWGRTEGISPSTVTLYIFYLRKKLQDTDHGHEYIRTQRGRGYWFSPKKHN